jgi:phenylpropionate dioxygenase-like ring-hydroxylating dioxygenase large terminal subunit
MKGLQMLGLPIVLCRDRTGGLAAMRDICPHRGMPLSFGRFDGERVECSYHGWQFDMKGRCRCIPALPEQGNLQTDKIGVTTYPAEETDGMIWLYLPDERGPIHPLPPVPRLPLPSEPRQSFHISLTYTCTSDDGIIGLIDPVHGPYVHSWWRSDARMHEKTKIFDPIPNGFRMIPHRPAKNSGPFHWVERIYGGPLSTTIDFVWTDVDGQSIDGHASVRYGMSHRFFSLLAGAPLAAVRQSDFSHADKDVSWPG